MKINTIYLMGLANGLKPRIILETLSSMPIWNERKYIYITDSYDGVSVEFCREQNIDIIIIDKDDMNKSIHKIKNTENSLLVTIGWSKKVPNEFLDMFNNCINCHGGLLPDYRGNNVYMHSYANISDEYGVTVHFMNSDLDDGDILIQSKLKLYLEETPEIIHRRISEITGMIIPEAIRLIESGFRGIKQVGKARYFFKITREEMNELRKLNIENMRASLPKVVARNKEWKL